MSRIKTSLFLDPDIVAKGKIIARREGKSFVTWVTTLMASAPTIDRLTSEQEALGKFLAIHSERDGSPAKAIHFSKHTERVK